MNNENKNTEMKNEELSQVNGGLIPNVPPADGGRRVFQESFNGSEKTVHLNIGMGCGPEGYDCSGLIS